VRMFVAVRIPVRIQRELARLTRKLAESAIPVRWVAPENMHLTLRFLGQVPDENRRLIVEALSLVAQDTIPFDVAFGSVGAFPSPRRPDVIWIAVESAPRLRLLRGSVERQLAQAGFRTEVGPFHPHVTLGRALSKSEPGAFREFVPASRNLSVESVLRVSAIDLVRSRLRSTGAEYELLDRVRLGAGTLPAPASRK
jgi:2'-5' RNA ligase